MCVYYRANRQMRRRGLKAINRRITIPVSFSKGGLSSSSGALSGTRRSTVPREQIRARERQEVECRMGKALILILAVFMILALVGNLEIDNFFRSTIVKKMTFETGVKGLDICCIFGGFQYLLGFGGMHKCVIVCKLCEAALISKNITSHVLTNQMKM